MTNYLTGVLHGRTLHLEDGHTYKILKLRRDRKRGDARRCETRILFIGPGGRPWRGVRRDLWMNDFICTPAGGGVKR